MSSAQSATPGPAIAPLPQNSLAAYPTPKPLAENRPRYSVGMVILVILLASIIGGAIAFFVLRAV